MLVASLGFAIGLSSPAGAELYINEIFWDAGGGGNDERDEYIELRGTPAASLANHFLIFLENEDDSSHTGGTGEIDGFFDFNVVANGGAASIGSNGFLMLRQKGNLYDGFYGGVAAGTTNLVNSGVGTNSQGWGNNFTTAGSSTVGFSWATEDGRNQIENSGFTAMLIQTDGMAAFNPVIGQDLDVGNNGLDPAGSDVNDWRDHWTIVDAIGVHAEGLEAVFGRTYAQVNFGTVQAGEPIAPGVFFQPNIEPGAEYVGTTWSGREIEYLARWGDSNEETADAWHASNVTDREVAGSAGPPDYRQSGDPHPTCFGCALPPNFKIESTKNVPYGTVILDTQGAPNMPVVVEPVLPGDYNDDGVVDAVDYTVWRNNFGTAFDLNGNGDENGDSEGTVDEADYTWWKSNYGSSPLGAGGLSSIHVPEPSGIVLALASFLACASIRPRRRIECMSAVAVKGRRS
jgi:hypothetical protein